MNRTILLTALGAGGAYLAYKLFVEKFFAPPENYVKIEVPIELPSVDESAAHEIADMIKPEKVEPSFKPMGIRVHLKPIVIKRTIQFRYKPPPVLIRLKGRSKSQVKKIAINFLKAIHKTRVYRKPSGTWVVYLVAEVPI